MEQAVHVSPSHASDTIIDRWLGKADQIEKGGLAEWGAALSILKCPDLRPSIYRSVADRLSVLRDEGLIEHPMLLGSAANILKTGLEGFRTAGFSHDADVWCTVQPNPLSAAYPNIKGQRMTPQQLMELIERLDARFPKVDFRVTAFPYIQVTHQASIMVNSDRSITMEVAGRSSSVSRGDPLLFTANSRPFQSWPLYCSSNDPVHIEIARLLISKIPKVGCPDGLGEERKPGYYELSVGVLPGTAIRRAFFNDFRVGKGFTL